MRKVYVYKNFEKNPLKTVGEFDYINFIFCSEKQLPKMSVNHKWTRFAKYPLETVGEVNSIS